MIPRRQGGLRTWEQELQESQNDLRKTIGELETVNEELQGSQRGAAYSQ